MIKTVGEALELYKAELRSYKVWVDGQVGRIGLELLKNVPLEAVLDGPDLRHLIEINARLRGMVDILGLSQREERAIDREIGVVSSRRQRRGQAKGE